MTSVEKDVRKKITGYQLFGWAPLLLTMVGAGIVVTLSVIRDLA